MSEFHIQEVDVGALPVECRAVANALSYRPVQVTHYISDFQKVTVSGLCTQGADPTSAAAAYVSGTIYDGTTVEFSEAASYGKSGLCAFTVTFNVLP